MNAILGILITFCVHCAAAPTWQAGFASTVITPERSLWMAGYAARKAPSNGKSIDLFAKAIVLTDAAGRKSILITLDLLTIERKLSFAISEKLRAKYHVPREAIVINASHTHSGPVVGSNLSGIYFLDESMQARIDEYTLQIEEKILQTVDAAYRNQQVVRVKYGVGRCGFAVNRRENPEDQVPAWFEAGKPLKGLVDHSVPTLRIEDKAGKICALIFGYACHATTLDDNLWSGDYPAHACATLEAKLPGVQAMFVSGCGGDQNPIPRRSHELAKKYGQQLATAVIEVVNNELQLISPRWSGVYSEIPLEFDQLPTRAELNKQLSNPNKYVAARAKKLLATWDRESGLSAEYLYPVQTWQLGEDLSWIFLAGEVVVGYSLNIKNSNDLRQIWVSGYCNDVMAYIPTEVILKEGGYEGSGAMLYYGLPSSWKSGIETRIMREVRRQMQK